MTLTVKQVEEALEVQDHMVSKARGFREEGIEVAPMGFAVSEGAFGLIPLYELDKQQWVPVLRKVAKATDAIAVGMINEAWAAIAKDDREFATTASAHAAGISLRDLGGTEVIFCRMETRDGRERRVMIEIQGGKLGKVTDFGLTPACCTGVQTSYFQGAE